MDHEPTVSTQSGYLDLEMAYAYEIVDFDLKCAYTSNNILISLIQNKSKFEVCTKIKGRRWQSRVAIYI